MTCLRSPGGSTSARRSDRNETVMAHGQVVTQGNWNRVVEKPKPKTENSDSNSK
jgi:hypothetical protein